jgi:phosphopantothenoylcysteine decarboxylase/phosphopantothenate--cysteine ligase
VPDPVEPFKSDARFQGVPIVIGVTGGIAAYKTCSIVSALAQSGADVTVCMTESAQRFVTPMTFQALSGRAVICSNWEHDLHKDPQHIALARAARAVVVAPVSMNSLARLATGFTDDPVSLVISAVDLGSTPVLLAPSMNAQMWDQPSTQRNLAQLRADGFRMIDPDDGWQACRTDGKGRMAEPARILHDLAEAVAPEARA